MFQIKSMHSREISIAFFKSSNRILELFDEIVESDIVAQISKNFSLFLEKAKIKKRNMKNIPLSPVIYRARD